MMTVGKVPGSFRDPAGHVFVSNNRVYRGVNKENTSFFRQFLRSDFYQQRQGISLVSTREVTKHEVRDAGIFTEDVEAYGLWVEHQRIPLISYPFEWSYSSLKQAAILTLALLRDALEHGYTLKDASAYNIQFIGCQPIFIDLLSFTRYRSGSPFAGYKQFCEQFYAPLCLSAYTRIDFNAWFRGKLDGLDIREVAEALPLRTRAKTAVLIHIHLHAAAIRKLSHSKDADLCAQQEKTKIRSVSRENLIAMINSLSKSVAKLQRNKSSSYWQNYVHANRYDKVSDSAKVEILKRFVKDNTLSRVLDLGCNTGRYTKLAIHAGAKSAIGIDADSGAIDVASKDAIKDAVQIQYLLYDIANPSPDSGWMCEERTTLVSRLEQIDGLICFALIHHIVIGCNIPMESFVNWVISLAPKGLIEFVSKSDPMVRQMLQHRTDIFLNYDENHFSFALNSRCRIVRSHSISSSSRKIYEYEI